MIFLKILLEFYTFRAIFEFLSQKAPDVPEDQKILKPCDYDMMLDHYPGDVPGKLAV